MGLNRLVSQHQSSRKFTVFTVSDSPVKFIDHLSSRLFMYHTNLIRNFCSPNQGILITWDRWSEPELWYDNNSMIFFSQNEASHLMLYGIGFHKRLDAHRLLACSLPWIEVLSVGRDVEIQNSERDKLWHGFRNKDTVNKICAWCWILTPLRVDSVVAFLAPLVPVQSNQRYVSDRQVYINYKLIIIFISYMDELNVSNM